MVAGAGVAAGLRAATQGGIALADYDPSGITATASLTHGPDRADIAFRACQLLKKEIAAAIGNKRVVIKVNFVYFPESPTPHSACTQASFVEGILEFLKSIGKRDVAIAECSATGSAYKGYDWMGYWYLPNRYPVKLLDLSQEGYAEVMLWNSGQLDDPLMVPIRVSKMLLNPNNFIISAAPIKTHNTCVATMATKNVAMGAPLMDVGSAWGQAGVHGDKSTMHGPTGPPPSTGPGGGADYQVLNDNVFRVAYVYGIRPHLAVLDGFQGVEGNGPIAGTYIAAPEGCGGFAGFSGGGPGRIGADGAFGSERIKQQNQAEFNAGWLRDAPPSLAELPVAGGGGRMGLPKDPGHRRDGSELQLPQLHLP